ncbi:MAG TPA: class I SAM-dependent methyltransferase [Vicinamibacterales bacterium]|nr:class I SAM-dependent methyltransferase [Vicinamibacterales bacterium]
MVREDADVETSSDDYARRFAGSAGRWFLERQSSATGELLAGFQPGMRVLDVGGGHAQLLPLTVARGFDVTVLGSDPSCAGRLAPWLDAGRCRFASGDLSELPFDSRSFDLVLSFRLLPHLHDWRRVAGELCRVARRSVVVDYPSTRSVNVLAGRLFGLKRRIEENTRPFALFAPGEIAEAFSASGFRVAAARPQFFFPMALHRLHGSALGARALEAAPRLLGLTRRLGSPVIVRADRV